MTWSLDVETGELTISGTGPMWNFDDDENMTPLWDWYDYITSVVIQSGVTTIGEYAFPMCTGLVSVSIPDSVVSIGDYAFCMCISLESVSIPASMTSIGESVFDCGEDEEENPLPLELQDIYYGGSAEDWEKIEIAASNLLDDVTIHYNWPDLDGDGEQNGDDLTLLARHIAGIELLSKEQEALADVNGKDSVSAGDLTTLARNLLG